MTTWTTMDSLTDEIDKRRGVEEYAASLTGRSPEDVGQAVRRNPKVKIESNGDKGPETGNVFDDAVQYPRRAAARMRAELRSKYTSTELNTLVETLESSPELAKVFRAGMESK